LKFRLHIILVVLFTVFSNLRLLSAPVQKTVRYDSTAVKTIIPSKEKEEKVFAEVDVDFARKVENKNIGLWDRFWNWILESLFGDSDYESRQNAQKLFFWFIAIAGLGLVIWLLTRTQFTSFLKGNTKKAAFNFSDVEEDISGIDFNARISKAVQENDLRLAIRWQYLKQLYLLNEKQAISYQPFKTNIDYTQELSGSSLQKTFTTISRVYDYVWYGKYTITQSEYHAFETEFKQFEESIGV
jgi:hypothetical protein